jgi:hypothetical protein
MKTSPKPLCPASPTPSLTCPESNPVPIQPSLTPSLTPKLLADLACRLGAGNQEDPRSLVMRAMAVETAASEALSTTATSSELSFVELASLKKVPSMHEKTGTLDSGKGVEKAVIRFFDAVLEGYDHAMEGRNLAEGKLRENKATLEKLKMGVLKRRVLSASILPMLTEFQNTPRARAKFVITLDQIQKLLGNEADLGRPGFDDL